MAAKRYRLLLHYSSPAGSKQPRYQHEMRTTCSCQRVACLRFTVAGCISYLRELLWEVKSFSTALICTLVEQ